MGRVATIIAPGAGGMMTASLGGIGDALSIMAMGSVTGVILVMLFLPETTNREIQDCVAAGAGPP